MSQSNPCRRCTYKLRNTSPACFVYPWGRKSSLRAETYSLKADRSLLPNNDPVISGFPPSGCVDVLSAAASKRSLDQKNKVKAATQIIV